LEFPVCFYCANTTGVILGEIARMKCSKEPKTSAVSAVQERTLSRLINMSLRSTLSPLLRAQPSNHIPVPVELCRPAHDFLFLPRAYEIHTYARTHTRTAADGSSWGHWVRGNTGGAVNVISIYVILLFGCPWTHEAASETRNLGSVLVTTNVAGT
jgi:hypothetical protein